MNRQRESRIQSIWECSQAFHGSPCPLLALGVRVCDTALNALGLSDPAPNRLVCVSEYEGCCIDAIQVGLHCTSGKKHLLFHKTGRLVFTVYDLWAGTSLRICTRRNIEDTAAGLDPACILAMDENDLFYFEEAHPLTKRTLEKVNRFCAAPEDGIPDRDGGIQDSSDQFLKYDLADDGLVKNTRRR